MSPIRESIPRVPDVTVRPGDPRLRLFRHVVGARLHQVPEMVWRIEERTEWEDPQPLVPERDYSLRTGDTRPFRKTAEPRPNAPQLIRLIQHPFALRPGRPVRDESKGRPARIRVSDQQREPFGRALAGALEQGRRPRWPSATAVHPPHPRRERPSADAWLQERGR
ncbi:MAG: hypothetical protein D6798_08425 [Deltaproteobacteria bacterium]|nr:MAG: hypothetical protein D6798_08425 [Deltaproteobacteria bacterium]